jgi:DNA-binding NarL/FixJ family response regulator
MDPMSGQENRTLRVVIGEDHPLLARGVQEVVDDAADMHVVGVAGDRDSVVAAVTRETPDVVVCDLRMPPTQVDEGLQVLQHIEANRLRTAFILFTQFTETAVANDVLANGEGGRGYMLKERLADPAEMHAAIRAVAAGSTVVDPDVVSNLMRSAGQADPIEGLSRRQREVLTLIAEGLSNEGIAERLALTPGAVEKRVTALFKALPIDDVPATNRRVSAALLYLSSRAASTA